MIAMQCNATPEMIAKLPKAGVMVANKGYDREIYRYRHLVENAFARLKQYRALATRFDKLKRNYESVVAMACAYLWLPM